jgi:hypothetical protein
MDLMKGESDESLSFLESAFNHLSLAEKCRLFGVSKAWLKIGASTVRAINFDDDVNHNFFRDFEKTENCDSTRLLKRVCGYVKEITCVESVIGNDAIVECIRLGAQPERVSCIFGTKRVNFILKSCSDLQRLAKKALALRVQLENQPPTTPQRGGETTATRGAPRRRRCTQRGWRRR